MIPENHKKIGIEACLPVLKAGFPDDDLGYFLLGNWFTDVSQGIAPVDYAACMDETHQEAVADAKKDSWLLRWLVPDFMIHSKVKDFILELLGDPPPKNAAMAKWFRNAVYVAGWMEFCYPEGPAKKLAAVGAGPLDFKEYDRIFHSGKIGGDGKGRFTQYYPHEHFDRWPMDRTEKSDRNIYKYMEEHILNLAELLTLVDKDWAREEAGPSAESKQKRHDILAEFGYAMHTVEDYWAHTNFVDFAMAGAGLAPTNADHLRIHKQRLLRDVKPRTKMKAPPGKSEPETHIVGGFFDGMDTRFSLAQIYKGVKKTLGTKTTKRPPKWNCGSRDCLTHDGPGDVCEKGVWTCRRVEPPCPGHSSPTHSCTEESGSEWNCRAEGCPTHTEKSHDCQPGTWHCGRLGPRCQGHDKPGQKCPDRRDELDWRKAKTKEERQKYKQTLGVKQRLMQMPQKVRDAELAFIELDWQMIDKWEGKCVSWVLERMMNEGKAYAELTFGDPAKTRYSERIGSHTLIAKDDDTKQPGFKEAMNLAKRLDRYIMNTMVRSVKSRSDGSYRFPSGKLATINVADDRWVDWLDLLQYFMGHPAYAKKVKDDKSWWELALPASRGLHGHNFKFVSDDDMSKRVKLKTRKRLEEEHNSMIRIFNAKYEKSLSGDGVIEEKIITLAKKNDSEKHQQDDMDHGSVRVRCLRGKVKVELSAAIWWSYGKISAVTVEEGDIWSGDFTELSSSSDQDNRTVVTALVDNSKYEIMMVSYDR